MRGAFSGAFGPEMKAKASTWAHETPDIKSLPDRVKKKSLKKILKKHTGKGGPIPTPFAQASSPIDLLKSSSVPPTVRAIPNSRMNSLGKR